jgi:hypothetical protein
MVSWTCRKARSIRSLGLFLIVRARHMVAKMLMDICPAERAKVHDQGLARERSRFQYNIAAHVLPGIKRDELTKEYPSAAA